MKMKPLALSLSLIISAFPALADKPNTDLHLMPYPQQVTLSDSNGLVVDRNFSAKLTGFTSERLESAVQRLNNRIERQTGFFLTTPIQAANKTPQLIINVKAGAPTDVQQEKEDESYSLDVSSTQAVLNANTPYGALHGIETFLQLLQNTPNGAEVPAVNIEDSPRFPWRGALIDTSRHFIPVNDIKRQIDGLASAKFNTFHWHLTDDQGWRIESLAYPNLHEKGSDGLYYTREQIKDVVAYAKNLGIRVIPEVDLPGHASAIAAAYPELMTEIKEYKIERKWGVHEPLLDPTKPEVYTFIDKIIGEVTELFPDKYIHIGGDEVNPKQWNNSKAVQVFMAEKGLKDALELHAYFNQEVEEILKKHDRKMIGWDETYHPDLPKSIVIQSWRGHDSLGESANDGYQGILSTGYYIDQAQPAAMHYRNDPMPKPLQVDDKVHTDESWETWQFEAPRKRGSAVTGTFTLITAKDGTRRGFIDYKGRSRRAVFDIETTQGITSFWMDSWMGQTKPRVELQDGKLTGHMVVGNAQYTMTGQKIAGTDIENNKYPTAPYPVALKKEQEHLILGGEVTLWAENVKYDTIDLRMWPRSYVIAERLWSAENITDVDSMYERMETMGNWATVSVGLQHEWNALVGMKRLANGKDIRPLQVLAEAVEQAQYYHRHHEKSTYENYDRFDPLNRFADALPPESLEVRQLNKNVTAFIVNPKDSTAKIQIVEQLQSWIDNNDALVTMIDGNYLLKDIKPVVKHVTQVSQLGLDLIKQIETGKPLTANELESAKKLLNDAQQIQDEVVVSAAYPVEMLLHAAY
ncbi:family 20 glycosylhydrolase [Photobacterium profundum]|uniref:family 20 glycosylhydrolase n=1 Tax=Photobacterium profundum TaxID=74109 RepID=UPI003D0AB9CB